MIEPLLRHYIGITSKKKIRICIYILWFNDLDRSIDDPNMNPVRAINDQGGKEIEYVFTQFIMMSILLLSLIDREYVCMDDDRMISICRIQMPNGTVYQGEGTNKKTAKANACRKAMKSIHSLN